MGATVRRARTLPFTCTGITISSAFAASASKTGHRAKASVPEWPNCSHSSSAVCGANGDSMTMSASSASRTTAVACARRRLLLLLGEGIQIVDQLHHRRDRGVELLAHVDVRRDAPDRVVRLSPQRPFRIGQRRDVDRRRSPLTAGASAARCARRAPATGSFRRGRCRSTRLLSRAAPRTSHTVATHRRRPSAIIVSGIDDVAFRLRHDVAVLEHHALRQQMRERLGVVDHAEVAEDARKEARVDQVQNRVLDAAAVEVDGTPVRRPWPGRTAAGDRCARRQTDRSTTTSRRTYPSCRSRAAPARRTSDTSR